MMRFFPNFRTHAQTAFFFKALIALDFKPTHIVDIGAHKGAWTYSAMKYFPRAEYTLFEPQSELLSSSPLRKKKNVTINNIGVGDLTGPSSFTLSERKDSSSFSFTQAESVSLDRIQVPIQVVTLDDYFSSSSLHTIPSIIKIDAEGWDEKVISGASRILSFVPFILVECSVMNPHFSNTVSSIVELMDSNGFKVFDITDLNRSPNSKLLWNIEMAFYNPTAFLMPELKY